MAYCPDMRSFLAILLLAVLPLQAAYAFAASYCHSEGKQAQQHAGHHEDGGHAAPATGGEGKQADSDCGICHLACAQMPMEGKPHRSAAERTFEPALRSSPPPRLFAGRLERPPRAALA